MKLGRDDCTLHPSAGIAQRERADRYLARLDRNLAGLDCVQRLAFLDRQLEIWERRYARFIASEGASEPVTGPKDPPQAADFLLVIASLSARLEALP